MFNNTKTIQHITAINLLALVFFIFDRLFKKFALHGMSAKYFELHYNQGMAFGLNFLNRKILYIVIIVILVLLIWVLVKIYKSTDLPKRLAYVASFTFIIFGALGNLVDRFFYGQVVDYINLGFWPVFNIADVMIVIGAIIIILNEITSASKCKMDKSQEITDKNKQ